MAKSSYSAAASAFGAKKNVTSGYVSNAASSNSGPFMLMSGYEGANSSPARGYVYWPQVDSRRELSDFSEQEIRRRIHWLCANYGMARRLYRGCAKLLGILTPFPTTSNDDWNELAFENFMSRAGAKMIFDRKGRYDFFTAQPMMNRARFKVGRILDVLTETASGGARNMFYEAHQIKNGPSSADSFERGIRTDRFDRHDAYSIQDGKNPELFSTIPARDSFYYANWEDPGALHGLSILAHAVVNMIDIVELRGMRKHAAKNHAQIGMAVETAATAKVVSGGPAGVGGPMIVQEVVMDDGSVQEVNWEMMTTQGVVPHLKPGQSIKVIADDRPTPNNMEFEKALVEDCILGVDLPPSALYHVAGLTGPGVRFNMEDIRRWIAIEHRNQAQWCQWYYGVHMAREVKAGRLPEINEPYWRQVEWIGQPDPTIDRGRDGQLSVTRLGSGLTTWGIEYAKEGMFAPRQLKKRVREVAMTKREIIEAEEEFQVKIDWGEVFPAWRGGGESAQSAPDESEEDRKKRGKKSEPTKS